MFIPEDFKTRLKIAKSKIKKKIQSDSEKKGSFIGNAFKFINQPFLDNWTKSINQI